MLIVCTPGAAVDAARQGLRERRVVYFDSFEQSLRVLALLAQHDRIRAAPVVRPSRPPLLPLASALDVRAGAQSEREVKRLLATYSIAVAREVSAVSPEDAADAAARVGFPIVLKAISRDIVHKSEVGAVRVGLQDRAAAVRCHRDCRRGGARQLAGARPRRTSAGQHF